MPHRIHLSLRAKSSNLQLLFSVNRVYIRAIASLVLMAPVATMASIFGTQSFPVANADSTVAYFRSQARAHVLRGQLDEAAAEYSRALSLSSSQGMTILLLADRGRIYHRMRKFDSALADYDRAIKLAPEWADLYLNRSAAYMRKGEFQKADADLSECVKRDPHNPLAYIDGVNLSIVQHKDEQARANLDKALKLRRRNAHEWNGIAWLQATCPEASFRDGNEAIRAARKACDLTSWKDNAFIDTLAAAYAEAGDFDHAIMYQEQALGTFSGEVRKAAEKRLALYREHKPYREELWPKR